MTKLAKRRDSGLVVIWIIIIATVAANLGPMAVACGVTWGLPTNHFDGVDSQGDVSYWEWIGDVDFGNGLKFPMNINFSSARRTSSPYLGQGWMLPLLEARIFQTGEDTFLMIQPDGSENLFRRGTSATELNGSGGWKGEIDGDTIRTWATCGWALSFSKGHIVEMTTPKNAKLDFSYSGNVVTAIRENGETKLATELDPGTGQVKALLFEGKRVEITQDQKPSVQNIAGQNVVSGMDQGLKSIAPSDGPSKNFEFSVNDKVLPTLKITNNTGQERLFTWNPSDGQIVGDNDWTYQITKPNGPLVNAAIGRTNSKKQSEYWYDDREEGRVTVQGIDGVRWIKIWFVSGFAAGKPRKTEQVVGGKTMVLRQWDYDEKGHLIRKCDGDTILAVTNNRMYLTKNGITQWTLLINQQ